MAAAWATLISTPALAAPPVSAEPAIISVCRPSDALRPMLTLRFAGAQWTPAAEQHVTRELEASAARRGLTLCPLARAAREVTPLASIELDRARQTGSSIKVKITVRDAVTDKHVSRVVDVGTLPPDAQPIALAVASDELLRASWLELSLRRRRATAGKPAPPPPPPAVERVVRADIERAHRRVVGAARRSNVGAALAFDGFTEGERHLGADVYYTYWLAPLFGLELSLGARRGLAVSSTNGTVQATALGGALGALLCPLRSRYAALAVGLSLRLAGVVFRGEASGDALASSDTGLAVSTRARAGGIFTVGRLQLRVLGGVGVALVGVAATDDGQRISSVSGLEIFGQLGIGFVL